MPRRLSFVILLVVALVSLARCHLLATRGFTPGALLAVGESRWFPWAYRDPELREQLQAACRAPLPIEQIHLIVDPGHVPPSWYRVMGHYYLAASRVTGVSVGGASAPTGVELLRIRSGHRDEDGSL